MSSNARLEQNEGRKLSNLSIHTQPNITTKGEFNIMAKRTMKEIENDFNRILTFASNTHVTSINEIAEGVGLSQFQVKFSLAKHPGSEENILAQLEKNKEETNFKRNLEEGIWGEQKKFEEETKIEQLTETADFDTGFVIDASITGINNLEDVLSKICATKAKIILTSITIKELEKLQKFHDSQARDARHILAMAAEMPQNFYTVLIDETIGIPDDCIIKYCADNKHKVSLLTSDKTMALKARMYGVQTQYFKQEVPVRSTTAHPTTYPHDKKATLSVVKRTGNNLYITDFNNDYRSILLISNNLEYSDGVRKLKIGDDVYLATKKPEYMTFAHYQITSLSTKNNSRLVFSIRIYHADKIRDLPKSGYRNFMYDFMLRHDL